MTIARAAYCLAMVIYMCIELNSIQKGIENMHVDIVFAFTLLGLSLSSSWLLVYEYVVGARELKYQLKPFASTR